jgi:hypothetical protein
MDMYPEGFPSEITAILISDSVALPYIQSLKCWKQTKDLLITSSFCFLPRDSPDGLHIDGHTTQLCVKKGPTRVRRFWVYFLFHLKFFEFEVTVPFVY